MKAVRSFSIRMSFSIQAKAATLTYAAAMSRSIVQSLELILIRDSRG